MVENGNDTMVIDVAAAVGHCQDSFCCGKKRRRNESFSFKSTFLSHSSLKKI